MDFCCTDKLLKVELIPKPNLLENSLNIIGKKLFLKVKKSVSLNIKFVGDYATYFHYHVYESLIQRFRMELSYNSMEERTFRLTESSVHFIRISIDYTVVLNSLVESIF